MMKNEAKDQQAKEDLDIQEADRKAVGYVVKRLGLSSRVDEDTLETLFAALSVERRGSVLDFLDRWFVIPQPLRKEIQDATSSAEGLSEVVWRELCDPMLEIGGDEEEVPGEEHSVPIREGRNPQNFRTSLVQWVRRTAAHIPASEATLAPFERAAERLADLFGLTDGEREMVLAHYCVRLVPHWVELGAQSGDHHLNRIYAKLTGLSLMDLQRMTAPKSALVQFGLLKETEHGHFVASRLALEFLAGVISESDLQENIRKQSGATFSLSSFGLDASDLRVASGILASGEPRHLLLYGAPGAGKTELARALISKNGRSGLWVVPTEDEDESAPKRLPFIRMASRMAKENNDVLVIDEADPLLNTELWYTEIGKATLVRILDEIGATTIWIVNDEHAIHEAVRRRFGHSLPFNPPQESIRYRRLTRALQQHGLAIPASRRRAIARTYQVSLGSLTRAVDTAAGLPSVSRSETQGDERTHGDREEVASDLEVLLAREHELLHGSKPNIEHTANGSRGTPVPVLLDAVNSDVSLERILAIAERFLQGRREFGSAAGPLNLRFSGVSGTGKTVVAQEIARRLGRRLRIVTASDLLDMYVGNSEKNVASVFAEAQQQDEIILLDEAENLLQKRSTAHQGHERQLTNEFLYQIERHNTICIATTNESAIMDEAFRRRFALKATFYPPTPQDRVKLYRAYFTLSDRRLTQRLQTQIRNIEGLTPGTIRTVYDRFRWLIDESPRHEEIIAELEAEVRASRDHDETVVVGFTA